ncbi:MAG: valine--tRNA ligase [Fidelibacterota bacterium]
MTGGLSSFKRLPKVYDPTQVEKGWYDHWQKKGYFHARVNPDREPYTVLIPPPNVTGSLTIGHVLNNTVQDILVRRARMQGREACWIPGTDHASIATETRLSRMLEKEGLSKEKVGRRRFLDRAWEWKNTYGSLIDKQLKRLGCSCDWERERFTMDDGYTRAVLTAFVMLYNKGFIYRGTRLVNWCPKTRSAISDEEVIYRAVRGHLWYLKYPLRDGEGHVVVATTRPETMLGDTAVAVHPDDSRFRRLHGKSVILPLVGREMPVIADESVDPEFGTGCVKVTPAHDPSDFEIAQRHRLDRINILEPDGSLNDGVPEEFRGLDRFVAREAVVTRLREEGYLERVEDYETKVGYSDRGNVPIEPYLSEQWFMRMKDMAGPALDAVRQGRIRFFPEHWVKTYEHWMENIRDWCISRQLWWGHRIPVWYHKKTGEIHCEVTPPEDEENWDQDPDVLDTWASSWLWPIAVHGWPEKTEDLRYFHPSDDLVTAADIIFFWVARMIMASLEFEGDIPFRNVFFTGMVRDIKGRKMSKSLGNSPDPIELMDTFGADALRYGIVLIAPRGQDILFSNERIEVGRNFMNKLWNASRFLLMVSGDLAPRAVDELDHSRLALADRWILSRMNRVVEDVNRSFESFRFNEMARRIYEFTWSDFCDWYVEIIKSTLYGKDSGRKTAVFSVAAHVLSRVLKLLHPCAPFITEEIWQNLIKACPVLDEGVDLTVSGWPHAERSWVDMATESDLGFVQEVVTAVRTVRAEMNVPLDKRSDLLVRAEDRKGSLIDSQRQIIMDLAKVDTLTVDAGVKKPVASGTAVVRGAELFVPLEGIIDVEKEKQRLLTQIQGLDSRLERIQAKLGDREFLTKAPPEVVSREKKKLGDLSDNLTKLKRNYKMLL